MLETQMKSLTDQVSAHAEETRSEYQSVSAKLDNLLTLKHKGMGAFWLASTLIASGLIGFVSTFVSWLRG